MARFALAIDPVLEHEGGLVDHPDDPGGITNYGISIRWAKSEMTAAGDDLADILDVDDDGDLDGDDIRALDEETAKKVYEIGFWDRYGYARIVSQNLANKVFDMTVNMGPKQSHKNLQRGLRACGLDVSDDGVLGPKTMSATQQAPADCLLAAIRSEQAGFYRMLIARNRALRKEGIHVPDFGKFEHGWLRRAYS